MYLKRKFKKFINIPKFSVLKHRYNSYKMLVIMMFINEAKIKTIIIKRREKKCF